MDTDFFEDKKVKLLKAEFGARGLVILLSTLCRIYSNNGYYTGHDKDDDLFEADKLGCGITPELVREVVQGSVKRSFFDEGVFNQFGVLTSPGIQRRYIRAVSKRDDIPFFEEYWLLDIDDENDVPKAMRVKVTFKTVSGGIKAVSGGRNPDKTPDNPQSKVKERKVKESTTPGGRPAFDTVEAYASSNLVNINPRQMQKLESFRDELPDELIRHAIDKSCLKGKPYFTYASAIMQQYVDQGYRKLEDALLEEKQRKAAQQPAIPKRKVQEWK